MTWRHLTLDERYQIQAMAKNRESQAAIARALGRSPSTISRELQRNVIPAEPRQYLARRAAQMTQRRRVAKGAASRKIQGELAQLVEQKLRLGWSPEQIAGRLASELAVQVSHETIYQHVLRDNALPYAESKRLRYCLRWHGYKHHRFRKSRMSERTRARKNWIKDRPQAANKRTETGHWERDLLLGKRGHSALLTIIDRKSRYLLVEHVLRVGSAEVAEATVKALRPHQGVTKTMTNDNGAEFQRDAKLQTKLGIPIFFTEPAAPWQRGSIENANGLIRQYLPKGADLDQIQRYMPEALEHALNFRPRKILDYRVPHEVFFNQELNLMTGDLMRFGIETGRIH
ncbi:MAG: IS30 family transposase [Myxococcales bacterium]|nr:IS30 family transposase [Myxococcales bacterium]